jgi:hypothetical protein
MTGLTTPLYRRFGKRIVRVSLKMVKIVNGLPKLNERNL